jgi:hypothetical protein
LWQRDASLPALQEVTETNGDTRSRDAWRVVAFSRHETAA